MINVRTRFPSKWEYSKNIEDTLPEHPKKNPGIWMYGDMMIPIFVVYFEEINTSPSNISYSSCITMEKGISLQNSFTYLPSHKALGLEGSTPTGLTTVGIKGHLVF